ncbi:hypothetical protein ZIOFF_016539 [Zingiber officinale]|uniref:Uncharacterized protein n=1 Tax=Zingiber officinale TaxID=94328 RepID=A0A8J5HW81_ZINOF|nr:hypothetical protein ZIOFF_016539 [Zingiber officinale]
MAALSSALRSRVSASAISAVLRARKNVIIELEASPPVSRLSSLRKRSSCIPRILIRFLPVMKVTGKFELLDVDASSPQRDCHRSSAIGSRCGVPTMGFGSTRYLNAFMMAPVDMASECMSLIHQT